MPWHVNRKEVWHQAVRDRSQQVAIITHINMMDHAMRLLGYKLSYHMVPYGRGVQHVRGHPGVIINSISLGVLDEQP